MIPFSLTTLKSSDHWPVTDSASQDALTAWQHWIYPQGTTQFHRSVYASTVQRWALDCRLPVVAENIPLLIDDTWSHSFAAWQLPNHEFWLLIPDYGDGTFLNLSHSVLITPQEIQNLIATHQQSYQFPEWMALLS